MPLPNAPNRTVRLAAAASLSVALLAGCGGSLSIGIGDDWDDPPEVEIDTAVDRVAPGGVLRVVAAATDDYGVDDVEFYRRDDDRWTLIVRDRSRPFDADVPVPDDGRTEIEVFARATDDAGQSRDSASLVVAVVR